MFGELINNNNNNNDVTQLIQIKFEKWWFFQC